MASSKRGGLGGNLACKTSWNNGWFGEKSKRRGFKNQPGEMTWGCEVPDGVMPMWLY